MRVRTPSTTWTQPTSRGAAARLGAVLATLLLAAATCDEPEAGPGPIAVHDAAAADGAAIQDSGPAKCGSSKDCAASAQVCDKTNGQCVDCNLASDCVGQEQRCIKHHCDPITACQSDKQCQDLDAVCDKVNGVCVDCLTTDDCRDGDLCKADQCVPPATTCDSSKDCAALGQVCSSGGECVDCEGDLDCEGVEFCSEDLCVPDVCLAGQHECVDETKSRACASNGSHWQTASCGAGETCAGGVCSGSVCAADQGKCDGGKTLNCNASGTQWLEVVCVGKETCVLEGGVAMCAIVPCNVGATACTDEFTLATCKGDGSRAYTKCQPPKGHCLAGACVVCKPGTLTCAPAAPGEASNVVLQCSAKGDELEVKEACGANATCTSGACAAKAVCAPGALFCAPPPPGGPSSVVMQCNGQGTDANIKEVCATAQACAGGKCQSIVCLANTPFCLGDKVHICAADGLTSALSEDCPAKGAACLAGKCLAPLCAAGTKQCKDGKLQTCKSGNEGWVDTPCAADQVCTNGDCQKASCSAAVPVVAPVAAKADVIVFIDTSGSMGQEAKSLNNGLNPLAETMAGLGVDYRIILLAKSTGCCKVCIPPPLGGANCANNSPKFTHEKVYISSSNGLTQFTTSQPTWSKWLRPDATKHIIAVTDDNSFKKNPWFEQEIAKLNTAAKSKGEPEPFKATAQAPLGFIFHSIVAYNTKADCPTLAKKGTVYLELTAKTKGVQYKICVADWLPFFSAVGQATAGSGAQPCIRALPADLPKTPAALAALKVSYEDGGIKVGLPLLADVSAASCGPQGGVAFDNAANPMAVLLCPVTCADTKGKALLLEFPCGA